MSIVINKDRNVAVGGNAAIGGHVTVMGDATVRHNLRVDGWIEARNIKGANKGVFLTVEDLTRMYPRPCEGWYAGVGAGSPFEAYVARHGVWTRTGGVITVEADMNVYREAIARLEREIESLRAIVANMITPGGGGLTAVVTAAASPAGGGAVSGGGQYAVGSTVTLTAVANAGYRFVRWSDGERSATRTVTVSAGIVSNSYTAEFEEDVQRHTVTARVRAGQEQYGGMRLEETGAVGALVSEQVRDGEDSSTFTAVPSAGYALWKWTSPNTMGSLASVRLFDVRRDEELTAWFEVARTVVVPIVSAGSVKTYNRADDSVDWIEVQAEGGRLSVAGGSKVMFTYEPATGADAAFEGWRVDGVTHEGVSYDFEVPKSGEGEAPTVVPVMADEAPVEPQDVTLTIEIAGEGTCVVMDSENTPLHTGDSVKEGERLSLAATPATGSLFKEWRRDNNEVISAAAVCTYTVPGGAQALTLTAEFDAARVYYAVKDAEDSEILREDTNLAGDLVASGLEAEFTVGAGQKFIVLYDGSKVEPDGGTQTSGGVVTNLDGADFEDESNFEIGTVEIDGTVYTAFEAYDAYIAESTMMVSFKEKVEL